MTKLRKTRCVELFWTVPDSYHPPSDTTPGQGPYETSLACHQLFQDKPLYLILVPVTQQGSEYPRSTALVWCVNQEPTPSNAYLLPQI